MTKWRVALNKRESCCRSLRWKLHLKKKKTVLKYLYLLHCPSLEFWHIKLETSFQRWCASDYLNWTTSEISLQNLFNQRHPYMTLILHPCLLHIEGQRRKEAETTEVEMLLYIIKTLEKRMELNKISLILIIQFHWQSWGIKLR